MSQVARDERGKGERVKWGTPYFRAGKEKTGARRLMRDDGGKRENDERCM